MVSAFAPGRLELIGNHTDYNDGYVMSIAINLGVTIQGVARDDHKVQIRSNEFGDDSFEIDHIVKNPHIPWSNYVKGTLLMLQEAEAPLRGFDAEITSTLPAGAGMSSSAAVEVATALFAQKAFDFTFGDMTEPATRSYLAQLCQKAENEFVGVKCGILDQTSSLMGKKDHAIFIDCRLKTVQNVPLHPDVCFVVCHTGAKHMLLSSKYNARRTECEEAVKLLQMNKFDVQALRDIKSEDIRTHAGLFMERVFRRAMHVTTENERVLAGVNHLLQGQITEFGQLMFESHASSKDAFENSTPFLDQLVEIAHTLPGCLGARLTGGGFGGATINMVLRDQAESFASELQRQYKEKSGKDPQAWILDAADGAA